MDTKYSVLIQWSNKDGCYIAKVLELPGCMADGETMEKAVKAVQESASFWAEINKEGGFETLDPIRRARFMQQLELGIGDYTKEKYEQEDLSIDEIAARIRNKEI